MGKGLLSGYPDGTFKPENPMTRAEFATVLCRYLGMETTGTNSFSDAQDHWAAGAIGALADAAIVTGYPDGTFKPDNKLTRAEAVTMINRAIKMSLGDTAVTFNPTDIGGHWAEQEILAATNVDMTPYKR